MVPTDIFYTAEETCSLPSMPTVRSGHTLDQIRDGTVIACGGFGAQKTCDKFNGTSWSQHFTLLVGRYHHTSLAGQHGLLLMGGSSSRVSTEIVGDGWQYNLQHSTQ